MADNKTILEKADLAIADLVSDGGYLETAQSQDFIRHLVDEAVFLNQTRVVPMRSHTQTIEGIRIGTRVLRPGVSAQALSASDRVKPTTNKATLTSVLVKGQIDLDDETLEDNIEQGTLRQTIIALMTEQIALDLDELAIQGDTASADPFLALYDGCLKSTTTNIVDAGITKLTDTHMKSALKTIPSAALRNKNNMKLFTSVDAEIDYRDYKASRGTPLGDMYSEEWKPVQYSGVKVMPVPLFPENLGVGTNETEGILCDPKNWANGIWRRIRIESQRSIEDGVLKIVATLRVAGTWIYEPHTLKIDKIKVS